MMTGLPMIRRAPSPLGLLATAIVLAGCSHTESLTAATAPVVESTRAATFSTRPA